MTNHTTTTIRTPLSDDDPRTVFARSVITAGATIAAVCPDQLGSPTPCGEFDTRTLLGHLVSVLHRVAAIGRQEDPFSVDEVTTDVTDDGWHAAWLDAAHDVQTAWTDDATLARMVHLPWATLPGGPTLAMYTSEITVHTWDLAQATGQRPVWNDQAVTVSIEAMRQGLPAGDRQAVLDAARANMPAGMEDFPSPFANAVEVPPDSAGIDRLVAWTGRNPAWSPQISR